MTPASDPGAEERGRIVRLVGLMIADAAATRAEHKAAAQSGQKGRWVDAAAAAIRQRALEDARNAIERLDHHKPAEGDGK